MAIDDVFDGRRESTDCSIDGSPWLASWQRVIADLLLVAMPVCLFMCAQRGRGATGPQSVHFGAEWESCSTAGSVCEQRLFLALAPSPNSAPSHFETVCPQHANSARPAIRCCSWYMAPAWRKARLVLYGPCEATDWYIGDDTVSLCGETSNWVQEKPFCRWHTDSLLSTGQYSRGCLSPRWSTLIPLLYNH